jgi:Arc/MetJ-type ribon-helix-helix transcriptional regulator
MLLCFRCSTQTKSQLDALVDTGAYRDHSELIAAAISNLFEMEADFAVKSERCPSVAVELDMSPAGESVANGKLKAAALLPANPATPEVTAGRSRPKHSSRVPAIFLLSSLPEIEPTGLADLPPDTWHHGQRVPLDRWILGQFNRMLPAKVNARALIHLFSENGPLSIESAPQQVANEALKLSDFLAHWDTVHKPARDEALATAFPNRQKSPEKGCTRYANQFVVYQNGRGELSGLMSDLKLINVEVRRRERLIVPTHTAWDFARLENPVLDGRNDAELRKFSDDERSYLLEHILHGVPVESFAYKSVLEAVDMGETTPEKLDQWLKRFVSTDRSAEYSQSFLTSQRSGAISRMTDLGLIERRREGVRVSYSVTQEGHAFLVRYGSKRRGENRSRTAL